MRNKLRGIALILFGFLIVYTMNVWDPSVPVIGGYFLPACNVAGLLFGLLGLLSACKPDE